MHNALALALGLSTLVRVVVVRRSGVRHCVVHLAWQTSRMWMPCSCAMLVTMAWMTTLQHTGPSHVAMGVALVVVALVVAAMMLGQHAVLLQRPRLPWVM